VGHLVDFEEAEAKADKYPTKENFIEVALCAVAVSKKKNSKSSAWAWAETAANWAERAGIERAYDLIEGSRYPTFDEFTKRLEKE
jgi:hypothetical protein